MHPDLGTRGLLAPTDRTGLTRFGAAHPMAAESTVIIARADMAPAKTWIDGVAEDEVLEAGSTQLTSTVPL